MTGIPRARRRTGGRARGRATPLPTSFTASARGKAREFTAPLLRSRFWPDSRLDARSAVRLGKQKRCSEQARHDGHPIKS